MSLLFSSLISFGQENLKIAIVDTDMIFNGLMVKEELNEKIELKFQTAQREYDAVESQVEKEKIQAEFEKDKNDLISGLRKKMEKAIEEVKQSKGIKYVIHKVDAEGQPIVLYEDLEAKKKFNITRDVMNILNLPTD